MPKSVEYSAPEYSDDEEPVVKPKEKKAVKESKNDEKIILPSQMGYKPKERFSLNPPPNPSDRISDNKPLQFRGRPPPRRVKRNERNGENSRESRRYEKFRGAENGRTMISTNLRPVREGTEFVNDQIHILYQSSPSVKVVESSIGSNETFQSFSKSQSNPESRGFLDSTLVRNLGDKEINKIRPIQAAMMTAVFTYPRENPETSKADILATSKTGSGKTLAFLIPILQKAIERRDIQPNKDARLPMALIFVNTTELAMNFYHVVSELWRGLRLKVVVMAGSLNFLDDPNFDIAICTSGRFQNHFYHTSTFDNRAVTLDLRELEYIVIDEVDNMVSDFKFSDVLDKLKAGPSKPRIFGFSATIDIMTTEIFRNSSFFQIKCGQHNAVPSNINQFFWEVKFNSVSCVSRTDEGTGAFRTLVKWPGPPHPFDVLYKAITEVPLLKGKRILVFVKHTRIVDYIAARLRIYGIMAVPIHKKLAHLQILIDMFNKGEANIAIATQYFTRGIDTEIDVVINFDLPVIPTDYIHRCGRTGRNGNSGIVITFIDFLDPGNYNPEVIHLIIKALAENENAVIPLFLKQRVAEYKEYFMPE